MTNKIINVLITSMGSTTSIVVSKHIKASMLNVKIFGTDLRTKDEIAGSIFVDTFLQVPSCKDVQYIDIMKSLVKEHQIDFIIPIFDLEIYSLSEKAKEFEEIHCKIIASTPQAVNGTNDKYAFFQQINSHNILTPKTYSISDWKENSLNTNKKWILKPIQGVSSRDILIGSTEIIEYEINKSTFNANDFLIQEFLDGKEFTVDIFVKNKKIYCCVPRERTETRGGLCYSARTVSNKEFLPIAEEIVKLYDFYGPINIQFIEHNKQLYCIEVNPRFAGSSIITTASGINLFEFIYNDFTGKELTYLNNYKENLVMNRYWEEVFVEN